MAMKFALVDPHRFLAIYFETAELANDARQQLRSLSAGYEYMTVVRVGNDEPNDDSLKSSKPECLTKPYTDPIYFKTLKEFGLSFRVCNYLEGWAGIKYIGQLIQCSARQLSRIQCIGDKSIAEIKEALAAEGLELSLVVRDEAIDAYPQFKVDDEWK